MDAVGGLAIRIYGTVRNTEDVRESHTKHSVVARLATDNVD